MIPTNKEFLDNIDPLVIVAINDYGDETITQQFTETVMYFDMFGYTEHIDELVNLVTRASFIAKDELVTEIMNVLKAGLNAIIIEHAISPNSEVQYIDLLNVVRSLSQLSNVTDVEDIGETIEEMEEESATSYEITQTLLEKYTNLDPISFEEAIESVALLFIENVKRVIEERSSIEDIQVTESEREIINKLQEMVNEYPNALAFRLIRNGFETNAPVSEFISLLNTVKNLDELAVDVYSIYLASNASAMPLQEFYVKYIDKLFDNEDIKQGIYDRLLKISGFDKREIH